jgi:hypothetical protein
MPLQIRYAKMTIAVYMPVCSRTEAEAIEIARDHFKDFLSSCVDDPSADHIELLTEQPSQVDDDDSVWGECVPEDAETVAQLREHLAK